MPGRGFENSDGGHHGCSVKIAQTPPRLWFCAKLRHYRFGGFCRPCTLQSVIPNLQEREGSSRRVVKIELWLRSVAARGTVDSGSLAPKTTKSRYTPEERGILDFMCAYQRLRVLLGASRAPPPGRDCLSYTSNVVVSSRSLQVTA